MTAPGGIPPRGPGRLLEQLMAAQLDAIAARLADATTPVPVDAPAVRLGDRVEWSAVAESLASLPAGTVVLESETAGDADPRARALGVQPADATLAARLIERTELTAEPLAAEPRAPAAPLASDARLSAEALRLALPSQLRDAARPARSGDAADDLRPRATGGVSRTSATGTDAPRRPARPRLSRWRIALLVVVIGAALYGLGATLGGGWALAALGACACATAAGVLGVRGRRRSVRVVPGAVSGRGRPRS